MNTSLCVAISSQSVLRGSSTNYLVQQFQGVTLPLVFGLAHKIHQLAPHPPKNTHSPVYNIDMGDISCYLHKVGQNMAS